ncbi:MAG: site-specific integrase [Gammaproteobacteria bacterium]|nr:site-specific integrase [Gammaproteobacteria bacterium]
MKEKLLLLSDWAYAQVSAHGRYVPAPAVEPHAPLSSEVAQAKKKEEESALPLSKVLAAWAEAKRLDDGESRSLTKTVTEFSTVVDRFADLHGDLPVSDITRTTCQEFRASLARMPTSGKGIRSLSASQAIARAEAEGLPLASAATVRKQLKVLSTLLNFASQRMGLIPEDPVSASGLLRSLAKSVKKSETRTAEEKGYTSRELVAIFSSPLFLGTWSPPRADYGQALYWLPLLMAYTGARREEVAQLLVADIRHDADADCWFMDICPGEGKTLKTHSSRRKVPLHPDLLALGFVDYVASQPLDGRLFPKLTPHPVDGYGHAIGKTWANYLADHVGLGTVAFPFHGFRHAFKTACRDVGIEALLADMLTGHAPPNEGAAYGTYPMRRLYEEVQRLPSLARLAGLLES